MLPTVAVTPLTNVPVTVPAVNRPEALIELPGAATDQVGLIPTTLPFASLPMALYWPVVLTVSVLGFGAIVIDASVPTSVGLCSHAANSSATNAAATSRTVSFGTIRACMGELPFEWRMGDR